MFFECKVYDRDGKLKRIHTAEELEEASTLECLELLPDKERRVIEVLRANDAGEDIPELEYSVNLGGVGDE